MQIRSLALTLPLALGSIACQSAAPAATGTSGDEKSAAAASTKVDEPKKDADAKKEEESKEDKLRKKQNDLDDARMELSIAKLEAQANERSSTSDVEAAEARLKLAIEARDHFVKVELVQEMAQGQLGIEQNEWSNEETRQEHAELEAMYKKDDVATLTKELVLQRGKKRMEFSARRLELARKEFSDKREFTLARKQTETELALKKAEDELAQARMKLEKTKLSNELKLRKSERAIDEAERALAKARGAQA